MKTAPPSSDAKPLLAFVYHPASFSVPQLVAAARGLCSLAWVVDSTAHAAGIRALKRFGEVVDIAGMDAGQAAAAVGELEPTGILTLKDSRLRATADLADRLGLAFHSPQTASRLTDKYAQRAAFREAGLETPGFETVSREQLDDWLRSGFRVPFPAVLKPKRDSEASRDTLRVDSIDDLRAALETAEDGEFLLEEYLADRTGGVRACFADYVSVESVVSGGQISHLAVNGRFPPAEPFRESGFFIQAELEDRDRQAALDTATAALEALGVTTGCPHTEVKFTPDGPRVIEVNGRIGGGVPEMLADLTGVDLLQIAMRVALGERVSFAQLLAPARVGFLFYVHAPRDMRQIEAVDGLDRLRNDPDVIKVMLNRAPGETVDWREGNHGHVFWVRGTVADHDALEEMDRRVHSEVTIIGS